MPAISSRFSGGSSVIACPTARIISSGTPVLNIRGLNRGFASRPSMDSNLEPAVVATSPLPLDDVSSPPAA